MLKNLRRGTYPIPHLCDLPHQNSQVATEQVVALAIGEEALMIIEVGLETDLGLPSEEIPEVDLEEIDDHRLIVTGQGRHLEEITEVGLEQTGGQVQEDLEGIEGQAQVGLVQIEDQVQADLVLIEDQAQEVLVQIEDQVQADLAETEDQAQEDSVEIEGQVLADSVETGDQAQEDSAVIGDQVLADSVETGDQVQADSAGIEDQAQVDSVIVALEDHLLTEMTLVQMIEDQDHMLI